MRPHRLRMTAFGPFPGTVEVDLDRLAASGLFLLHGETGAGKTTLLDGLGFALYGTVPGARQKAGRLRSDTAVPGVRTEVQLEVTLGGRRWRITRRPAQERPKVRGTGTTTEQAGVLLEERVDGRWSTVSTRLDEAAQELDPLLGMSSDQFFQVVLLPQGEFAQFLRAKTDDRIRLLQRLFGTERFRAVEDWLAARRAATAAELVGARHELDVLAARLAQAADADAPEEPDADWLDALAHGGGVAASAAATRARTATVVRDGCRAAAEQAVRLGELQRRRRTAETDAGALAAARPEHERLGVELAAADRAAELASVLADSAAREAERVALVRAEAVARTGLTRVQLPVGATEAELRAAADRAREQAGRLDGLRAVADDLAAERAAAAAARREVAAATAAAGRCAGLLNALPARRRAGQAAVAQCRAAAQALPVRTAELLVLRGAVSQARALAEVMAELAELRDEHLLARETAVSLREKEAELREARLTSMVAELAATLEPGAPCEVCGSLQHPDPYEGAGEGVSRDDEERARAEAEHAARRVADLGAAIAAATATAEGHRHRLLEAGHDGADPAALETAVAVLADEVEVLRPRAAGLDAALAEVEQVEQEQVRGDAEQARWVADGAAAERRGDASRARAARLEAVLADSLGGALDLAAALEAAEHLSEACALVLTAAEAAARAGIEADRAARAADGAAVAAGFDGPDPAGAALRSPSWREQARVLRRAVDDRTAAVAAALADPELAVALEPAADGPGAAAALQAADGELEVAVGELAAAQRRLEQVAVLAPQVAAALAGLEPLHDRAARARRLADLCAGGGSNALRMSLSSFVLAARLEEVAEAASGRLLRMTQGRYSLRHTDGAAKGGARSGLGLLVRDSWTGRDRDTATLSGGETFQASLALALGLADVVQAESGGTRIEALFVDEGFGTLDEETLDEVMDVLDGLREGGRVVGLVSHVAELKARIPAQVHVHKARAGSTVTLLGC